MQGMNEEEFKALALEAWDAVPEKWRAGLKNVALLIEDEPSFEVREAEGLQEGETLLGLYQGIPLTARGADYGVGGTMPDTITLYRLPILDEAYDLTDDHTNEFRNHVRKVLYDTVWHEVGHYFGLEEEPINRREDEGTNTY
jgi:predicted Zn-dependent protease with MMP-like domain